MQGYTQHAHTHTLIHTQTGKPGLYGACDMESGGIGKSLMDALSTDDPASTELHTSGTTRDSNTGTNFGEAASSSAMPESFATTPHLHFRLPPARQAADTAAAAAGAGGKDARSQVQQESFYGASTTSGEEVHTGAEDRVINVTEQLGRGAFAVVFKGACAPALSLGVTGQARIWFCTIVKRRDVNIGWGGAGGVV